MRDFLRKMASEVVPSREVFGRTVKRIFPWVTALVGLTLIVLMLWKLPQWQLAPWKYQIDYTKTIEPKDLIKLESDLRMTWAQILGGGALLIGLFLTWRTYQLNREGQITDRFNKAIDHLDYTKALDVRLGAIYALERIASDSQRDYWPVIEILTAYVREHARRTNDGTPGPHEASEAGQHSTVTTTDETAPALDIQTVFTVLQRRKKRFGKGETKRLDLKNVNLRRTLLPNAHLEGAIFIYSNLAGALLVNAHLEGALFMYSNLAGALLSNAHLEGAIFTDAHLEGAGFTDAHLEGANLRGAHLLNARLPGADLRGANLRGAQDLTREQLARAITDEHTALPDYLQSPPPAKPNGL